MQVIELVGAGVVLLLTLGVGTVAHELSHATVLHALGVEYEFELLPDRNVVGLLGVGVSKNLATVTPTSIPAELSPRWLRLSALAPLALAVPPALLVTGIGSTPRTLDSAILAAATVGWFACALPSPQDFSLFWHAEQVMADRSAGETDDRTG